MNYNELKAIFRAQEERNKKDVIDECIQENEKQNSFFYCCVFMDSNGNEIMFTDKIRLKDAHDVLDTVLACLEGGEFVLDALSFYAGEHGES